MSKQTLKTSRSMALEQPRGALGKVSVVFATKLKSFTFLPVLKNLPTENRVTESEERLSKRSEQQKLTTKSAIGPLLTPAVTCAEIGCPSPKLCPGTLDTTDNNKYSKTPHLEAPNSAAEVSSGLFSNRKSQREEEVLSPVSSVDLFTSPFSSRESILSEGWEQQTGWSGLQMPSGSVSPCSSVRSGAFTPSVMRIKCRTLAPASSLMHMPLTSCQTLGCNKHITSQCPMATRGRHRPPPTPLSLLTAILRKGRLPVLSSALQRSYSPCWPISPGNMSSCMACSAALTVAPIVGSQAKSCVSKGTNCTQISCKVRPKPPGLITKTECVSPKDQTKERLSSIAVETTGVIDSNTCASRQKIISVPEGSRSLTLSSHSLSPSEPPPAHLYNQTHKGIYVSTDPSLLRDSSLSRPICFSGHQSKDIIYTLPRNTNPCQASSPDSKHIQMTHERFPTPDHKPFQQSEESLASPVLKYTDLLQNNTEIIHKLDKIYSRSPLFQHSPSSRIGGLSHLSNTPSISPVLLSPSPGSCTSTSDRYTLSSSPAIPYHHLSPSPAFTLNSSPTPSLRDSTPDCLEKGSKKSYKIKSAYKALAAIPTNTLLLEQQAIDDEVNKKNATLDPCDNFAWEDPHSQMCSPAELRQQSAELFHVIDEVLKETNQTGPLWPADKRTVKSVASETTRNLSPYPSPSPRSLGRETKYANFYQQPAAAAEKTLTKPGVIRPATVKSRLDDDKEKGFLNTF